MLSLLSKLPPFLLTLAIFTPQGRVILVPDATATFAKGPFDAETVHAVNVESLRDEFAEIMTTQEVLRAMGMEEGA